jgi:hypothetical protein
VLERAPFGWIGKWPVFAGLGRREDIGRQREGRLLQREGQTTSGGQINGISSSERVGSGTLVGGNDARTRDEAVSTIWKVNSGD